MKVSLKSITPNAETNIVEIARVSSSRQDKTENPEGLINYLIKNNHWSPFEMSNMVIEIETSKSIAIQLLRHRSFSFQEFSQRYAKVENLEPVEFRLQADKNRQSSTDLAFYVNTTTGITQSNDKYFELSQRVNKFLLESQELYFDLLEMKIAKECARFVLPMCTSTRLYMNGTIRSWIHFLKIRDDDHAQKECRDVAREIKKIFIRELPIISKALNWTNGEQKQD